jgi:hypothetical protein
MLSVFNEFFGRLASRLACRRTIHQVQFFPGLESHRFAGCNADLGAGPGIAPNSGFARLNRENAKTAKLNSVASDQCFLHAVEDCVHCVFRLGPRKSGPLNDPLNKVLFDQDGAASLAQVCRNVFK